MERIVDILITLASSLQLLKFGVAALALIIGGITHAVGGANGVQKAKPWYIGGAVGFAIIALAQELVSWFAGIVG